MTSPQFPQLNQRFQQRRRRGGQAALRSRKCQRGRSRIRENLLQGFYSIRTVHRLGACYVFLILTVRVGPIPVRICPSPQSMAWYVPYAHVKGLPPQHCRAAQSLPPPQLRMRHEAHESLRSVHRHWTIMSKAHYTSPKAGTKHIGKGYL